MRMFLVLLVIGVVHNSMSQIVPDESQYFDGLPDMIHFGESNLTTCDFIAKEGYICESYSVTTPDGYILNLYRIPSGKTEKSNNKVVYLQHGVLGSSTDWIITGPNNGLGYILADAGYDVWMGNARGNKYSRKHTEYNPDTDSRFWQFSWHEIGTIDLPTTIDYVLSQAKVAKLYYVGHSEGTTAFYALASMKIDYNSKIQAQVSMSPMAYMSDMTSPLLQKIAKGEPNKRIIHEIIGLDEFKPTGPFLETILTEGICARGVGKALCGNSRFAVCGFTPYQISTPLLRTLLEQYPAGAASSQFLHYAQESKSGKFRQYDYGTTENTARYGQPTPPDYDLFKITTPVYLIYSKNDWLSGVRDVERLAAELQNPVEEYVVSKEFNNLDFVFGIDAPKLIYKNIVNFFTRH